jgi:hypothetical protein
MKIIPGILFLTILIALPTSLQAQCSYVGQEFCQNGEVYRCEKAGSELAPIFQNRKCTVSAETLEGTWRGSGHQTPAGDAGSDFTIVMVISKNGGSIDYPSLGCGGTLTRLSAGDRSAQFRESLTRGAGKCVDGGNISVNLFRGKLSWTWTGQQKGTHYSAIAVLERH